MNLFIWELEIHSKTTNIGTLGSLTNEYYEENATKQ